MYSALFKTNTIKLKLSIAQSETEIRQKFTTVYHAIKCRK